MSQEASQTCFLSLSCFFCCRRAYLPCLPTTTWAQKCWTPSVEARVVCRNETKGLPEVWRIYCYSIYIYFTSVTIFRSFAPSLFLLLLLHRPISFGVRHFFFGQRGAYIRMRGEEQDSRPEEGSASDREGRAMSQSPHSNCLSSSSFRWDGCCWFHSGFGIWGGVQLVVVSVTHCFASAFFYPFLSDLP
jgi:hypothetical protein